MPDSLLGLLAAGIALAVAVPLGLLWRARNGRMREVSPPAPSAGPVSDDAVAPELLAELGVRVGVPATLLQFSSAFCAPCRATRQLCGEVAAQLDGVRHVEVDAEEHLDAVRALGVLRTPTLFVIDSGGRVVRRASGQPTRAQLLAAVAPLLEAR
ncbi:MAG: TlpA family protein disulfide reductase [Micromonosporaceae bacterium]